MSDEIERKPLPGTPDPDRPGWNLLASYSAEDTARFLGGGELGPPTWHDPEIAERVNRQRESLRRAWAGSIDLLAEALHAESQQTARRLLQLWDDAEDGNPRARNLLGVLITELLAQALMPPSVTSPDRP